jgi:hypothetical protein
MLAPGTIEEFAGLPIAQFKEKYPNIHLDALETFDVICDASVENNIAEDAITVGAGRCKRFDAELLFSSRPRAHRQ